MNAAMVEEFAYDTAGATAEAETSGFRVNIIPKQGGNRFTGYFNGNYANHNLQSSNLDDDLRSRGLTSTTVSHERNGLGVTSSL